MSSSLRFFMTITRLHSPMSRALSSSTTTLIKYQNIAPRKLGYRYLSNFTKSTQNNYTKRRNFSVCSVRPGAPMPSPPSSSSPLSWIIGIFLTVVLPFAANTWSKLLKYKVEVDMAVEAIEEIVDVVEEVAEVVDKVAEGISHDLPEGGTLKKLADFVEDAAEETSKDAHIVGDAIDKVARILLFVYMFDHVYLHRTQVMQMHIIGFTLVYSVPTILAIMNLVWFGKILKGLKKTLSKNQ